MWCSEMSWSVGHFHSQDPAFTSTYDNAQKWSFPRKTFLLNVNKFAENSKETSFFTLYDASKFEMRDVFTNDLRWILKLLLYRRPAMLQQ